MQSVSGRRRPARRDRMIRKSAATRKNFPFPGSDEGSLARHKCTRSSHRVGSMSQSRMLSRRRQSIVWARAGRGRTVRPLTTGAATVHLAINGAATYHRTRERLAASPCAVWLITHLVSIARARGLRLSCQWRRNPRSKVDQLAMLQPMHRQSRAVGRLAEEPCRCLPPI